MKRWNGNRLSFLFSKNPKIIPQSETIWEILKLQAVLNFSKIQNFCVGRGIQFLCTGREKKHALKQFGLENRAISTGVQV